MQYVTRRGILALILSGAIAAFGEQTSLFTVNPKLPVIPQRRFVITRFGAVGNGKTMNTDAFRKAIQACKRAGGGEVIVPRGTFATGPIELTDNMALVLAKGATIRGSEKFSDYVSPDSSNPNIVFNETKPPVRPLISGTGLTNVAIRGEGTIDGAGKVWWERFRAERAAGAPAQGEARQDGAMTPSPRPRLVLLTNCKNAHIQGVTLKDSPNFHLVPHMCEDVLIEGLKIIAPPDSPNTDAIDPSNSRNVLIRRCFIDVGDDNVAFKSSRGAPPLENVLVTDCTFKHGHGVSVGSNLGSGIRNITVQRCTFEDTTNGIRIKSARDRGAVVEHVTYRDITMKNVGTPITINMYYFDKSGAANRKAKPITATTPIVRDVRVINVTAVGAKTAGDIVGLPEMPVSNVVLDNVRIGADKGMIIQDAKGVELRNVQINQKQGNALTASYAEINTSRSNSKK
jgi:polygalacturonase